MQHYQEKLKVFRKESARDIVTDADRLAENLVINIIDQGMTNETIITEEQGIVKGTSTDSYWLVDALDGTVNFVNQIPLFCVSIAFINEGRPIVGVIYNPMSNELYYGAEKIGAYKNQNIIRVANRSPRECLFSVAFSGKNYEPARRREEFILMGKVNDRSRGCLRTGSAAMNLAFVAEGRLGGCWGKANKYWDIAAGLLLAGLAGATVQHTFVDKEKMLVSYLASNPCAESFMIDTLGAFLGVRTIP